ncbi:BppU-like baseplate protein [Lactobacillus phage ATCCB]|nr:BppU-like baseplate protein [Lactobacillus phage ATCCB]
MKLASFTDNSQSFLKYGDTNTFLHVQISEDGTFVDLTQALAVNVPVANDDGLLFTKTIDPTKLASGDSGIVDINFTSDDQNNLPPDDYYLEIWVTNHDGTIGIYPADENQLMFTITDNLTLITGDVVPAVAFDDFQNMFNTLQQQVHDAIANGLKGNTGEKGDPGEGLDIKGKVTSVSALPTTASEGNGYLVNEELYVYTSGAWKDCGPIQGPQGIQGIQGKTGTGVSSTTIQYQISSSATTAPTGTWSDNIVATTTTNPNLWMKATLHYTDGTTKDFYLVSQKGDKGDKGDRGNQIFNGKQYTPNTSGYWWSDLTPTPSVDNPPKIGDTIINPNGDILQIDTIVVGGVVNGGGTFGVGNVLENIKGATGPQGPVGAGLVVKGTVNSASQLPKTGNQEGYCYFVGTDLYVWDSGAWKNCGSVSPDLKNYVTVTDLNNGLSTKVTDNKNGTIEVNGSSITPADDSKVIHNSGNEEINGQKTFDTAPIDKATGNPYITKSDVSPLIQGAVHDGADLNNELQPGTYFSPTKVTNGPGFYTAGVRDVMITWTVTKVSSSGVTAYTQMAYNQIGNMAVRNFVSGSGLGKWTIIADDSKVLHSTDMRKPASDVAGIEEVNAKQDKIGYTPADDSKVAHLSGANNFNTVPTVNNNPLLLASSLPSDLARTGSDQEFTGKNTFDIAPIDKATGNPYITKDGVPAVPSTLADTTKDANFTGKLQKSGIDVATKSDVTTAISTATANMVDSTKATNFTAGLQSGGIDVATAADLKSVKDSAWRQLDFGPDANLGGALASSYIVYQIHADEKYLSFFYLGVCQSQIRSFSDNTTLMDLSSIVKGISSIDFYNKYTDTISDSNANPVTLKISGTKIITSTSNHRIIVNDPGSILSLSPLNHSDRRIYYTELV